MTTHNGNPVFRGASGAGAGRGDNPHPEEKHGEEGLTRTQAHPLQGSGGSDTVGTYRGFTGDPTGPRSHFFSAEATGGGESDSFMISDSDKFKASGLDIGGRYAFSRATGHSGSIQPYNSGTHYGIPGAPMSDTPAKYHDRNYRDGAR